MSNYIKNLKSDPNECFPNNKEIPTRIWKKLDCVILDNEIELNYEELGWGSCKEPKRNHYKIMVLLGTDLENYDEDQNIVQIYRFKRVGDKLFTISKPKKEYNIFPAELSLV